MAIGVGLARAGAGMSQSLLNLIMQQRTAQETARRNAITSIVQQLPYLKEMSPQTQAYLLTQLRVLTSGGPIDPEDLAQFQSQAALDVRVRRAKSEVSELLKQFGDAKNDPARRLMLLQGIRSIVKEVPEAGFDLPYNITQGISPLHPKDIAFGAALTGTEREHAELAEDFIKARRDLAEIHPDWDDAKLTEEASYILSGKYPWILQAPMQTPTQRALTEAQTWRERNILPGQQDYYKSLNTMNAQLAEQEGIIAYAEAMIAGADVLKQDPGRGPFLDPAVQKELQPYIDPKTGAFDALRRWDARERDLRDNLTKARATAAGIKARIREHERTVPTLPGPEGAPSPSLPKPPAQQPFGGLFAKPPAAPRPAPAPGPAILAAKPTKPAPIGGPKVKEIGAPPKTTDIVQVLGPKAAKIRRKRASSKLIALGRRFGLVEESPKYPWGQEQEIRRR